MKWIITILVLLLAGLQYRPWIGEGSLAQRAQLQKKIEQYQAENDRLEVHVSTDCGVTWTSVYNKAGGDLATLPPSQPNYLNPG